MDTASKDTPLPRRPKWQKGLLIAVAALAAVGGALVLGLLGLNTGPGRAFLVRQIANFQLESGMKVDIDRIDGSLFSRFTIHDLRLLDLDGEFLRAPRVEVDWEALPILRKHVVVNRIYAPTLTLNNIPRLNDVPTEPDEPLFPDIDVTLGQARIDRIVVGPKVAGQQYIAQAQASGLLDDGRLNLDADASADAGDRLRLKVAIGPREDMLDLSGLMTSPVGGLVSKMAGLDKPLVLTLDGEGSWSRWDGVLASRLADADLLNLKISGRNGTFAINGRADPALVLQEGPAARVLADGLDIRSTFGFDLPNIAINSNVSNPVFAIDAQGGLNTKTSRLVAMKVDARLTEPAAVMDGVSGEGVMLTALLNGPMTAPEIRFDAQARRVGYETTQINGLKADGTVTMSGAGDMTVPVSLSLGSVTGLNEAVAGLLNQFKLDGIVQVTPEAISAEKVTFASEYLSGQAGFRQVQASGAYSANVDAQLRRYTVPSFGVVEGSVKGALGSDPKTGALTVNGDVQAQALHLENDTAREFLGGRPVLDVSVRQLADGRIVVRRGTVQAPRFNFNVNRGVYAPGGTIDLVAEGKSAAYGAFAIAAAGPATRPAVRATAANPDLGLGLRNMSLAAAPETGGYFVTLAGQSNQGDLNGRARISLDSGPIAADIEEFRFADLTLKGRVAQTPQGPLQGALALSGAGLNGRVNLAAEGGVQRADANIQALRARPPFFPALAIGEGRLQASVRLPESGPDVNASLAARLIQYGDWRIETASGTANFTNGTGTGKRSLAGRYKTPFEMALSATMQPNQAQVAMNGSVNGRRIRLENPAVVQKTGTGWRLAPTTVAFAGGRLNLEGESGGATRALASWSGLSLRFLDAIDPELGFSGSSSGTLRVLMPSGGQTPNAELRMVISQLQRAGLTAVSPPMDVGVNASLTNRQAAMRMLLRHENAMVGAMQARLNLNPAAGWVWTDQIWQAPLAGGMRFSGPVELLWAMSGLKGQELTGPLNVTADMSGTLSQPQLRGAVSASGVEYENTSFGTRIRNLALDARFNGSRLQLVSLGGTTPGGGKVSASGYADLNQAQNFPMDLTIDLRQFRAARTDSMEATISGPITIRRNQSGRVIEGNLRIDEARYRIETMAAAEIPQLEVTRMGEQPVRVDTAAKAEESALNFDLNVRVRAENQIFIQGMGLDSEWSTDLKITGPLFSPQISGRAEVVRGNYSFASRRFDLTRGVILMAGAFPPDPTLDIEASATVNNIDARLIVKGTARKPEISFSSVPSLPEDEILSRLLFGGPAAELSATEALQLAAALASLEGGGGGGINPLGKMRQAANIDRLRIVGADEATGRGTSLAVGQYLTDQVYVEVSSDSHGNTLTQLQIELTRALSILSQIGQTGESSLQLQYAKDY